MNRWDGLVDRSAGLDRLDCSIGARGPAVRLGGFPRLATGMGRPFRLPTVGARMLLRPATAGMRMFFCPAMVRAELFLEPITARLVTLQRRGKGVLVIRPVRWSRFAVVAITSGDCASASTSVTTSAPPMDTSSTVTGLVSRTIRPWVIVPGAFSVSSHKFHDVNL